MSEHPPLSRRRVVRLAVQLAGFAVGMGLLAWATSLAFSDANREQLSRLTSASVVSIACLVVLSVATLVLNGGVFWAVLRPVRRLRLLDVQAVNALATFLNFLPFKLSLISRVVIHNRRDRLPVLVIGGWFAAVAATMVAAITPLVLITAYEPTIGPRWAWLSIAALTVFTLLVYVLARALAGERGLARLHAIADPLRLRPLQWLFKTRAFRDAHQGLAMLGHAPTFVAAVVVRLLDLAVQAARLMLAAAIVGHALSPAEALVLAIAHFLIGVVSPAGALGFRETGSAGLAALLAIATSETFALIALVITAIEGIVFLIAASAGIAWLRPMRFFSQRGTSQTTSQSTPVS